MHWNTASDQEDQRDEMVERGDDLIIFQVADANSKTTGHLDYVALFFM